MSARQPAGTPTGGQFAAGSRPESQVSLHGCADMVDGNPLTAHQVTANANGKVLFIGTILGQRETSSAQRMVRITRLADEYRSAVEGSRTDPFRAEREAAAAAAPVAMSRHAISPHQVVSNADSKLLQIERIVAERWRETPDRMVEIARLTDSFRDAVTGSTTDPFRETR